MSTDKSELMMQLLDRYDVKFNGGRNGEQMIHCPNEMGHVNGDKNKSCSLNLGKGVLFCQGCMLKGDAYSVMMTIEGLTFKQAMEAIGKPYVESESDFLI